MPTETREQFRGRICLVFHNAREASAEIMSLPDSVEAVYAQALRDMQDLIYADIGYTPGHHLIQQFAAERGINLEAYDERD